MNYEVQLSLPIVRVAHGEEGQPPHGNINIHCARFVLKMCQLEDTVVKIDNSGSFTRGNLSHKAAAFTGPNGNFIYW